MKFCLLYKVVFDTDNIRHEWRNDDATYPPLEFHLTPGSQTPPPGKGLAYRRSMDGRSSAWGERPISKSHIRFDLRRNVPGIQNERATLNEVSNVHWHFVNLGGVVLLNVPQDSDVIVLDKVDCNTLTAEPSRPSNPMDVELTVVGKVVVDDKRHLLHVDTTSPDVSSDQHSALAAPELLHDGVSLLLRHVSVHRAHGEVGFPHLLSQPIHLPLGVAEDHRLCDSECVVEVTKGVELPFLPLDSHEELLDALERQLVTLHQDPDRIRHELAGHLQDLVGKCGRDQAHLSSRRKVSVDIVDLLLEPLVQHLVGLVEHQHLDPASPQGAAADHVEHSAWRSRDNMLSIVKFPDVFTKVGPASSGVTLHIHVIAKRQNHLLNLDSQLPGGAQTEHLGLPHC